MKLNLKEHYFSVSKCGMFKFCTTHFFFIRNIFIRNMRLRLQVLLTANSGNIEENKKTQSIN